MNTGPVIKHFGVDFDSPEGALTLPTTAVTRKHDSGWVITGEIHEDYYEWVNEFRAEHPNFGIVEGDFEKEVRATSEEAFQHFYANHKPEAWNYQDI